MRRVSPRSWVTWKGSTFLRESLSGSSRRISAASGTFSSCTTRPTTLATSRLASSRIMGQQVAPGSLQDYSQWVQLVAAMLRGGFAPEEAGKIAGDNYMRVFRAAVG